MVGETRHTRTSYRVDFYEMHTGDVEPCSLLVDEGERSISFFRLLRAQEIITCADCYRDATVQRERERRFHPERVEQEGMPRG
jgi:hypothetical protein